VKILQAGNSNFGYIIAKELRKRGIEADLLISKQIISGQAVINNPLGYDPSLDSYPEWVFFGEINKRTKIFNVIKKMKDYDLIHAYNAVPIHAMLSGKPYLAQSGGDDLRIKAFEKSLTGFLLRRAYKKANQFVYVWPIHKPYAEKLGIKNAIYLPRMWDAQSFKREKKKKFEGKSLSIFLPTVEDWKTKGNDKFLKAFVRLCKEKLDVFLYFVDWGKDSSKAKELLSHSQVRERVKIIPGPITREKMVEYMEKSDIVAEQFNSGSFTRLGIEAFTFGIPLLINLDEELHADLHGEAPLVINGKDETEIYTKLKEFLDSKNRLEEIGIKAQQWCNKNFDLQKNIDRYIEIYENIYDKLKK